MANNLKGIKRLLNAQKGKNDEFYTCYKTIEEEMPYYKELFNEKIIYCNCDDWEKSNFVKYFVEHFKEFNLKGLYATSFSGNINYDLFAASDSHANNGKYFYYDGVSKKNGFLKGNGDFRSPECVNILDKSDIIITNPPFSLSKYYVPLMFRHHKQFIILGNLLSIIVKNYLPFLVSGQLKCGNTLHCGGTQFEISEEYMDKIKYPNAFRSENGKLMINVPNICWFTNVADKFIENEECIFVNKKISEYERIENFGNIINVNSSNDIPDNYFEPMAVPITFFRTKKFNPRQFKFIGLTTRSSSLRTMKYTAEDSDNFQNLNVSGVIHNKNSKEEFKIVFTRMVIQRKDNQ